MTRHNDEQTRPQTGGVSVTEVPAIVHRFFHAVESGDWTTARALLADQVDVSHGSKPMARSREELTAGWAGSHARFESTRYELGPLDVQRAGPNRATARCGSRLTFVGSKPSKGGATRVTTGRYTVGLQRSGGRWTIRAIQYDDD